MSRLGVLFESSCRLASGTHHLRTCYHCFVLIQNYGNESDELEFLDDDPEAMMTILRHIYALPYPADSAEFDETTSLPSHALVYVTAEKYKIYTLKMESFAVP